MTHNEVLEFLRDGALLSLPSGKVRLWTGPMSAVQSIKNGEFSIGYGSFFGSEFQGYLSQRAVIETDAFELGRILEEFLNSQTITNKGGIGGFRDPEKENFLQSFQVIQGKIQRGEIEKAVPLVFAESQQVPQPFQIAQMIKKVLQQSTTLYVYGRWNSAEGFLGATPEILFHQQGRQLKTMALAGTLPKSSGQTVYDFQKDPKEIKEHQLVVEDICERLQKIARPVVGERQVVEFPGLYHLKTEIQLEVTELDPLRWIKMLHPTAALGVFPRNYGIQWMQELPWQKERGIFGAPILFPISHNEVIALVAIRNLIWNAKGSRVGAGCGIVANSDFNKEWEELKAKRNFVFQILGLNS